MVELAQRLRTSPNAEQPQERAACLTEQFPPPLEKKSPPTWEELPPANRRRLVALVGKLLESRMATQASGATASWEESDGDGSSS
jgi:hypothetical protein